jgi:transcriptional regulator with XRE-family HTH domain
MTIELMTSLELMEKFVTNIEKERIRNKMTQSELYKASGMSATAYRNFIANKNTSLENIFKLMQILNMTSNIKSLITIQEFTTLDEIRNENNKKVKKRVKRSKK